MSVKQLGTSLLLYVIKPTKTKLKPKYCLTEISHYLWFNLPLKSVTRDALALG
jgi:hypothetical protein